MAKPPVYFISSCLMFIHLPHPSQTPSTRLREGEKGGVVGKDQEKRVGKGCIA